MRLILRFPAVCPFVTHFSVQIMQRRKSNAKREREKKNNGKIRTFECRSWANEKFAVSSPMVVVWYFGFGGRINRPTRAMRTHDTFMKFIKILAIETGPTVNVRANGGGGSGKTGGHMNFHAYCMRWRPPLPPHTHKTDREKQIKKKKEWTEKKKRIEKKQHGTSVYCVCYVVPTLPTLAQPEEKKKWNLLSDGEKVKRSQFALLLSTLIKHSLSYSFYSFRYFRFFFLLSFLCVCCFSLLLFHFFESSFSSGSWGSRCFIVLILLLFIAL